MRQECNINEHSVCECEKCNSWHIHAKRYLNRLGYSEYKEQLSQHLKKGRKKSTFRYCPSEYHSTLIEYLSEDNERGFKATKLEIGYASVLKV